MVYTRRLYIDRKCKSIQGAVKRKLEVVTGIPVADEDKIPTSDQNSDLNEMIDQLKDKFNACTLRHIIMNTSFDELCTCVDTHVSHCSQASSEVGDESAAVSSAARGAGGRTARRFRHDVHILSAGRSFSCWCFVLLSSDTCLNPLVTDVV
jgi:hypothetical protein